MPESTIKTSGRDLRNVTDEYLGDGVTATFDGWQVWLEVDRGTGPESIALEPAVMKRLIEYAKTHQEGIK